MFIPGQPVEIRSAYSERWVTGFNIEEVVPEDGRDLYKLRRVSDDSVLPMLFTDSDVQPRGRL